jgi:hypothetical protein
MTRTASIETGHRPLSVELPYRAACGQVVDATLTVRALDGHDELAMDEAGAAGRCSAGIASILIGRCAAGTEGPIGVENARGLSAGDREVVLRRIYAATFSSLLDAQVDCAAGCGEPVCFEVDLEVLDRAPAEAGPWHRVRIAQRVVKCRVPDGRDLETALGGAQLALACVDGVRCDPDALAAVLARLDPNAECEIALTCPDCGCEFSAWLDGLELIRRQLRAEGGILAQVDRLASSYGWAETDILALPRERRLRYCAMAEARAA